MCGFWFLTHINYRTEVVFCHRKKIFINLSLKGERSMNGNVFRLACVGITLSLLLLAGVSEGAKEADPLPPRVPDGKMEEAKATQNPVPNTPENIEKGKKIFLGKGTCYKCHGKGGKGDGKFGKHLRPGPRNFTNPEWQKARADGELFWVIKNGSPGTGMVSLIPSDITEEEAWHVIRYIRSLSGT